METGSTTWLASLQLDYTRKVGRTTVAHAHTGPVRILKSLYPEGDAICHSVLVHPPSGLVGGDTIDIAVSVGPGAHALVTTPGASRFYRSTGEWATQQVHARLADGARLEWLPLETLAYNNCKARNTARFSLAGDSELIAWDLTALGLPLADQPFEQGTLRQHLEVEGVWLERGDIVGTDDCLLNSALGLDGHRCAGTLVFASGRSIAPKRVEAALNACMSLISAHELCKQAGVTQPNDQIIVLRTLSAQVEPSLDLLRQVWAAWRALLWDVATHEPRLWRL
jgi:urease accessory protein